MKLNTTNHDRTVAGLTYVYPVVSRRAGGVSVGINLSPNQACNWRCVYCQVPGLIRGRAPTIDLGQLKDELSWFLEKFLQDEAYRNSLISFDQTIKDVAISGDGEPTSSRQFAEVVTCVGMILSRFGLVRDVVFRLITNGSFMSKPWVRDGISRMRDFNGEVWIKVDRAREEDLYRINGIRIKPERLREQVETAASLCPTWIQTLMMACDGKSPSQEEEEAYLSFLHELKTRAIPIQGVWLYGLARISNQVAPGQLSALSDGQMHCIARKIEGLGWTVKLSL